MDKQVGIRLHYDGENSDDGTIVNGFKIIKSLGKDHSYKFLCVAPECGHECEKTVAAMKKSSTGLCRECSWKLPNTISHGNAGRAGDSPTHSSWRGMRERCNNPKHGSYDKYGGRGIQYDVTWEDFSQFLKDMGERPPNTTLDRIDVNGNYCKDNCRWVDIYQQAQNKRIRGRGIQKHKDDKGWVVTLGCNGEKHYLGYYQKYEDALAARIEAEIKYYGRVLYEETSACN